MGFRAKEAMLGTSCASAFSLDRALLAPVAESSPLRCREGHVENPALSLGPTDSFPPTSPFKTHVTQKSALLLASNRLLLLAIMIYNQVTFDRNGVFLLVLMQL